jgi:uroporphyrinogen-III decarboxylase
VDVLLYGHVSSPLWSLYGLIGYEGMMILPAQDPDLALYAGQRLCEHVRQRVRMIAALGADVVWIEECLTDQLSPDLFRRLNLPLLRQCTDEIRAQGLKSVYYYCGGPWDRMDAILDVGADAVHFEESKKGFTIHVEDIVQAVRGRCTVFGNLDAIGVLQNATEADVRSQVARQLTAGRRNGGRFVMSLGSPITPATPVERVRCYTDAVQRC